MNAFTYPDNLIHFGSSADRILTITPGERIVGPAIALPDGRVFYVEPVPNPTKADAPPTHKRVEGRAILGGFRGEFYADMLGFVTSEDRFVRPKLAAQIAGAAGQLARPLKDAKIGLQPADLWK